MLLDRSTFFVKERVGFVKLTDTYDILDPATQQSIGLAKEEPPGWAKWLRLLISKQLLPTRVNVYEVEGQPPAFSIQRPFTFLRATVKVTAPDGQSFGHFKSKLFSLGGGFYVFDTQGQQVAEVKGDWKGWNFKFLSKDGRELGTVTKKWAGIGKELFTSADNYIIALNEAALGSAVAVVLLLAAGLAIDIVFKESK
ncbi:MAG: oxidoreductase [Verrucomicrobia bacterium]|nr:oxidoreductase [Verrucomicrobiota bacterium]